jgi:hypothetical protein
VTPPSGKEPQCHCSRAPLGKGLRGPWDIWGQRHPFAELSHCQLASSVQKRLRVKTQKWRLFCRTGVLLASLVLVGCASLPKFQIAIDSDPQGARVEVNNEDIGKTPTTYSVSGNKDRSFNGNWIQGSMIEFVAYPPPGSTNLYIQRKVFRPSAFFQQGDHIPERIFFDLHLKSESIVIDLNSK